MHSFIVNATTDIDVVEASHKWQTLYDEAGIENAFLDWFWIGAWLQQTKHLNIHQLEIYANDKRVAMGFVCFHSNQVAGMSIKQAYLQRTGLQEFDQSWIEFNDILALPAYAAESRKALFGWLTQKNQDEWIFSLILNAKQWCNEAPDCTEDIESIVGFAVNLTHNITCVDTYIATLSSNSRSTLRRAIRYIEKTYGKVNVTVLRNALPEENYKELQTLHKKRWSSGEEKSGFFNPHFIAFHHYLQTHPTSNACIETLIFKAGNTLLGYLYNIVTDNQVKFYLSALSYHEQNNRYQPGLVMHAFAIAHYAKQDKALYDFMGGAARYKKSLSNHEYELQALTLKPNSPRNKVFHFLRSIKHWVSQR